MNSGTILILGILLLATLLLMRRLILVAVGRAIRLVFRPILRLGRMLSRPTLRFLRHLRIISPAPPKHRPVQAVVGLSVGALARAFTETDAAIAHNFDPNSVPIQRHRQFLCTWLNPPAIQYTTYDKAQAEVDFEKAKQFFGTEIPIESNPLNLYDDIDAAFVVDLLKDSDKACFFVLSEFRKAIASNVLVMTVLYSVILAIVAITNVLWSNSIDFHSTLNMASSSYLPGQLEFFGRMFETKDLFNTFFFGATSCLIGFAAMWLFQHAEFIQFQRFNGQHLKTFLVNYLAIINSSFNQIHANAAQTISEDTEVDSMKKDTVLWITNLHWTALRAFFIEYYLRNILFQLRRNITYTIFFVPLVFIAALFAVVYLFDINQFNFLDLSSAFYHQNTFYVFFPWLCLAAYRYLRRSVDYAWEAVATREWSKFYQLKFHEAMTKILHSYVTQLDRWRSVMKARV